MIEQLTFWFKMFGLALWVILPVYLFILAWWLIKKWRE